MGSFSIKVECSLHHIPMSGAKVYIDFGWNGHETEYTDRNGWAKCWCEDGKDTLADIYVNGEKFSEYSCYNGRSMSFTIDCNH